VSALVSIGEFSRLAHLSVKALRHYHDVGVFSPVEVDIHNGYRLYGVEQLDDAHVLRRLRELDMPLEEVKLVLDSGGGCRRDRAIASHLQRMELELERTRDIVASLRDLLDAPTRPLDVTHRTLKPGEAVAHRATVANTNIEQWSIEAFADLSAVVASAGFVRAGPTGSQFSNEYFEQGIGDVAAFVALEGRVGPEAMGAEVLRLSGGAHATTIHCGTYEDLDLTYGALGSHVAEKQIGAPGPITEFYVAGPDEVETEADLRTEVCWPIIA